MQINSMIVRNHLINIPVSMKLINFILDVYIENLSVYFSNYIMYFFLHICGQHNLKKLGYAIGRSKRKV